MRSRPLREHALVKRVRASRATLPQVVISDSDEILIVEDDPDTLATVEEVLADAGYRVTAMSSAGKALAQLTEGYRPAAMLVDLRMPQVTGQELLEACRADPALAGIPAIVMSADVPSDLFAQGVRWILKKPFSMEGVIAMVATAIRRQPRPRRFPAPRRWKRA